MTLDDQLLYKLKQAVLDNLANEQFSVRDLSRMAGMSRSHLHRKLKKLRGQSISQFIRTIRLNEALKLLNEDVATTAEIAYRVGFNSPSYFHKCFLDYFGHPPSEAKQIFQNEQNNKNSAKEKKQSSFNYKIISISIIVLLLSFLTFYIFKKGVLSKPIDKSIAVLPFSSLSEDVENQHFSDGLVEDLLNRLSLIEELKVISRTSSDTYRERGKKKVTEIAKELGVSYLVEGSVQKYDNNARITVQLIDAKNDDHVWMKTFDRNVADVFKVQSEIAMVIVSGLCTVLTEQQTIDIKKNRTENIKAFELYQLGRFYCGKRTPESLKTSIRYFEQALAEDPNYALAYAGLADTYFLMTWRFYNNINEIMKYRNKAEELALKALELDENLAEAYTVLATLNFFIDWDYDAAEQRFQDAFKLNSNYTTLLHRYSEFLSSTGRHKQARKHINKALELDPLSSVLRRVSADLYYSQMHLYEALAEAQLSEELNPNNPTPVRFKLMINYTLGNDEATLKNLKQLNRIYNNDPQSHLLDSIYKTTGRDGLIRWAAESTAIAYRKATLYGLLGDSTNAMNWLEVAFNEGNRMGDVAYDPNFKILYSNPRFIALLNKMGLPWKPDTSQ